MAVLLHRPRPRSKTLPAPRTSRLHGLSEVARRVLSYANSGMPRVEFLRRVSTDLLRFSRCSAVELRLNDGKLQYRGEASQQPKRPFRFLVIRNPIPSRRGTPDRSITANPPDLESLCQEILDGRLKTASPVSTPQGSFWTGDTLKTLRWAGALRTSPEGSPRSLALVRFVVNDRTMGLLALKSLQPGFFTASDVEAYERFAQTLGMAFAHRRGQWALRERVKELTCLYGIALVAQTPNRPLAETLQEIVELLPSAWQHPEIATARILLDGRAHAARNFKEGPHRQSADILVGAARRGAVEVFYTRGKAGFEEGPFLQEEQKLIDTIAREVSLVVERREAEIYKTKLQDQLRHADRLATIGQLAAGVAHELNEPLANILGFAQLAGKEPGLPMKVAGDLEKIVHTSLQARDIIQRLLVFARRMPLQKKQVNLNDLVERGLHFLESRCAKAGIQLIRSLDPDLPDISADPSQMQQVLVNLVVNAIQASPNGGKLTIETRGGGDFVSLAVADTGTGMTEEVREKIFTPFFTTKDVDQGTGLGLPVVHGIVASHHGTIQVDSQPGRGSRFEVRLPLSNAVNGGLSD